MPEEHVPLSRNEITLIREIVDTKIAGLKELLLTEIAASRQAVDEAEKALAEYKKQVNEWPTTFNKYSESKSDKQELIPIRKDLEKLYTEVAGLRESRAGGASREVAQDRGHDNLMIYIGIALSLLLGIFNLVLK